jgi:hypothetical protein
MAKSYLDRDAILAATDLQTEDVEVPEWGGWLRVKALNGAERDQFEASVVERKGKKSRMNTRNLRARLVAMAVVDEKNKPLFKTTDIEALGKKSAAALDRVFDVAMRLAGMRDEDIEELTENFSEDPSGAFTSN